LYRLCQPEPKISRREKILDRDFYSNSFTRLSH
jgi:hypothetical protein